MPRERRSHSAEFKAGLVERVKAGEMAKTVAEESKVAPNLLYRWVRDAREGVNGHSKVNGAKVNGKPKGRALAGPYSPKRLELASLQRQLRQNLLVQRRLVERIATLTAVDLAERMSADILGRSPKGKPRA